jgi:hypothetical protein
MSRMDAPPFTFFCSVMFFLPSTFVLRPILQFAHSCYQPPFQGAVGSPTATLKTFRFAFMTDDEMVIHTPTISAFQPFLKSIALYYGPHHCDNVLLLFNNCFSSYCSQASSRRHLYPERWFRFSFLKLVIPRRWVFREVYLFSLFELQMVILL